MNNRNNRTTRAIVASGSLLAIIVIGIPWVDEYLRLRRDAAEFVDLESSLVENQSRDLQLSRIESKLSEELESLSVRSIDPTNKNVIRESLMRIVRSAGGRLRRLDIADTETRPWAIEEDDPRHDTMPFYGEESNFVLYTHAVELQADGSLETVRQIVADIGNQGWLMTTKGLTASPTGVRESPVTLAIQLELYGLGPSEKDAEEEFEEEEFASLPGTRRI